MSAEWRADEEVLKRRRRRNRRLSMQECGADLGRLSD
jgi:hypothetical protein